MDELLYSDSEISELLTHEHDPDANASCGPCIEVVDDLTGEIDDLDSGRGPLTPLTSNGDILVVNPRSYQLEMLEESLKRNIIVAMDTGSGKTHIAVMRMIHEIEHGSSHQLIWFLAPTVSLCSQQYEYVQSQITSVQVKFLSGADNIERWTNQIHWDFILKNVKVVVSTYQILLEGLGHGFIHMKRLAMIVFDEAHNCVGNYPGAKIMQNFYQPQKLRGLELPKILGLTASPVMRSSPSSVLKIEQTLDAICRSPKKHRAELRLYVKLPAFIQVKYESPPTEYTDAVHSLGTVFNTLSLLEDPFYLSLLNDSSDRAQRALQKLILNHKTWAHNQVKNFANMSRTINEELGRWAADHYISRIVAKAKKLAEDLSQAGAWDVSLAEKQYLARVLQRVHINKYLPDNPHTILMSAKVTRLLDVLLENSDQGSGIIFVKERSTASMLSCLIKFHPQTRDKFKVGTVVGISSNSKRTQMIGEMTNVESSQDALSKFKSGQINLVISTSALEEGIDIQDCSLVICFEKPANLKSFVQRRGRARHQNSKLVLLLDSQKQDLNEWAQLEAEMKAIYEDEKRTLSEVLVHEDTEEHDGRMFRIEETNAMLDLDNAVSHLYHFCSVLPAHKYVDLRPDFICTQAMGYVTAEVILPIAVHEAVRVAHSQKKWLSEKNAIKDAAFQAYLALYHAGLVNNNLLPLLRHDEVVDEMLTSAVETRASLVMVDEQLNPWIDIAKASIVDEEFQFPSQYTIRLGALELQMHTPIPIPCIQPFKLYWDANTTIDVIPSLEATSPDPKLLAKADDETWAILQAAFGSRYLTERKKAVLKFSIAHEPLPYLLGNRLAKSEFPLPLSSGLIRDKFAMYISYIGREILPQKPPIRDVQQPHSDYEAMPQDEPYYSLKRLTRRLDFLHKLPTKDQPKSEKPYLVVLPISRCIVEEMPLCLVQFGLMIPAIMRRYEVYLVAEHLSKTLLKDVHISDLSLIVSAICASSACEETNYQMLEFLGDSILKMCTSVQLLGEYPLWHEGYLSSKKDRLVANSRLSRAAVETGLDRFIITKSFTGLKWRPLFVDDLLNASNDGQRQMSSKVLADVVEALIGAAMVDGGLPKALSCLRVFLPELEWQPLEVRRSFLYGCTPEASLPANLEPLEELIGRKFKKKALLMEAMTHASCHIGTASLERFEFLGDSVLDYIIVTSMLPYKLSHVQMHLLRTVLVNADFLAFICMEWSLCNETTDLITPADTQVPITKNVKTTQLPLWRFMRHSSPALGFIEAATLRRFTELRWEIKETIENGTHYPWALLARLQAQKFYSDLVESLLGAVWIDSSGSAGASFDTCTAIVERMGILGYMRRILKEHVHVWHPKEELGVYANTKTVRYVLEMEEGRISGDAGKEYVCTVFVGEEEVVRLGGGVSREEIKTRAAERAVAILKEREQRSGEKWTMESSQFQ